MINQAAWYLLWSSLLVISVVSAVTTYTVFSGTAGVLTGIVLAGLAAMQILRGLRFVSRREASLAMVMLLLFVPAQLVHWSAAKGPASRNRGFDFSAYYLAAKAIAHPPPQPLYYLPVFADGRMNLNVAVPASSEWNAAALRYHVPFAAPFIYPPFFALLIEPLGYLPFNVAAAAWKVLTLVFAGLGIIFSLGLGGTRIHARLALIVAVGFFSFYPFLDGFALGQIDCLVFVLLAAGLWLLRGNRIVASALCFATATLIKLTPVLVVPILIFHRKWKWLATYLGWAVVLLAFSLWRAGWTAHREFLLQVLPAIGCGAPISSNSSVVAYVQELLLGHVYEWQTAPAAIPSYACAVSRGASVLMYLLMMVRFYLRRDGLDLIHSISLVVMLSLAVSPISWWHHYVIALLPFIYLWSTLPDKGSRILLLLFLLVGTNVAGFSLLLARNAAVQLSLAALVPGLTIGLVYVFSGRSKVTPSEGSSGYKSVKVTLSDG